MPTPASTKSVRAWAQAEGLSVAERGRLRPDVLEAYTAAHGMAAKEEPAPAKTTPAKAKPAVPTVKTAPGKQATKAPAKTAAPKAPVRKAAAATAPKPAAKLVPRPKAAPAAETSAPEAARVAEDTRIADLQEAVAALTARVSKLEAPVLQKKVGRKS